MTSPKLIVGRIVAARLSVNGRPPRLSRITVRQPPPGVLRVWLGRDPGGTGWWSYWCPEHAWGNLYAPDPTDPDWARIKAHTDATLHATTHHKETR